MAKVGMPYSSLSAAATSSWVLSGLDAASATSAPPVFSVRMRLAVSVVTCMHAAMRTPASGLVFSHSARMSASTGMFSSAHSMRRRPAAARDLSLQSPMAKGCRPPFRWKTSGHFIVRLRLAGNKGAAAHGLHAGAGEPPVSMVSCHYAGPRPAVKKPRRHAASAACCGCGVLRLRRASAAGRARLQPFRGPPQLLGLVGPLPRQVQVGAAEMPVRGHGPVDGPLQLQVADDDARPQVEVLPHQPLDVAVSDAA